MTSTLDVDAATPIHGQTRSYQAELTLVEGLPDQHLVGRVAGPLTWAGTTPTSDRFCERCSAWSQMSGFADAFGCPQCGSLWDLEDDRLRRQTEQPRPSG